MEKIDVHRLVPLCTILKFIIKVFNHSLIRHFFNTFDNLM